MKVTLNVKLVNSKFNQAYADKENEGEETEDNIKYLWEDEFEVQGNVRELKVLNNATYQLRGLYPDDEEFCFDIPDMMIVECVMEDGSVTQMPFSKKAVSKTDKVESKEGFLLNVYLKSIRQVVNPMTGVYILADDFPKELTELVNHDEEE